MAPPRKSGRRGSSAQSRLSLIHLEIDSGPGRGERLEILEGQTTIGRADDCNFQIDSDAASRLHATVFREGDTVVIRDENSHNGTFVNEVEIDEDTQLLAGDKIQVGDSVLCLVINGSRKRELPEGRSPGKQRGAFIKNAVGFMAAMVICMSLFIWVLTRLGGESAVPPDAVVPQPALPEAPSAALPQASQGAADQAQTASSAEASASAPAVVPSASSAAVSPAASAPQTAPAPAPAAPLPAPAAPAKPLPPPVSAASVYRQSDTRLSPRRTDAASRAASGSKANRAKEEKRARSLYAQGDIQGALELAESVGAASLASRISGFQKAEGAARAAFSFKKGTEAIQHYEEAFGIDEEIMSALGDGTASVPGRRVARELSKLYQKAGETYFKKHDNERAAMFFERSLEYDASNAASRSFLKKFGRGDSAE